jgi:hypothetical protein
MDHATLVHRITAMSEQRSLLWHACGRAQRCTGLPGLPDLIIAGPGGVGFIECKTGSQLEPGQERWRDVLRLSGVMWLRADPADLWTGRIERELDRLAG